MAITRIKNNQITDSAIVASTKLSDNSITAGKLANNLTYGSNFTITGNLTVNGTTTTVDTNNMTVDDPLLLLASNQTGSGAVDIGFIGERGDDDNVAFVYDESADEFAVALTSTGDANTTITITDYADLHAGGITADDAISATGNVTGGNLITAGDTDTATLQTSGEATLASAIVSDLTSGRVVLAGTSGAIEDSTNLTFDGSTLGVTGAITASTTVTATGNVTGGNLTTAGLVNATGNVTGGNITTAGDVTTATVTASGAITGSTTITATGNVTGGNLITAGDTDTATLQTSGEATLASATVSDLTDGRVVLAGTSGAIEDSTNLTFDGSTLGVTGAITASTTITGTGNVTGGNLITAGDVTTATVTASGAITGSTTITATGNITGGNLITAGTFESASITATGNVTGGNLVTAGTTDTDTLDVTNNATVGGTAIVTGNVTGGNLITAGAVESASVDASGAIVGDTIEANTSATLASAAVSDLTDTRIVFAGTGGELTDNAGLTTTGTTLTATGNVTGGNITTAGAVEGDSLDITNDGLIGGTLTITGNLTVQGTTTTVDSTTTVVEDPVFRIGTGGLSADDGKDRGIEFIHHDGTGNFTGFFGYDDDAEVFTFIPDATNTNEVFTGTAGNVVFHDGDFAAITASETITATGNITGGNLITAGTFESASITATGNVTGGNLVTAGDTDTATLQTSGEATLASAIVSDLTDGRVVLAGTAGAIEDSTNLTFDGSTLGVTGAITASTTVTATGNVTGGNLITAGDTDTATLQTSGEATLASATVSDLTSGRVVLAGTSGAIEDSTNLTFDGSTLGVTGAITASTTVTATGNVTGGNLTTAGLVNATGNVTGGNLVTAGDVTTVTVTASGAIASSTTITATANVIGGNLVTAGAVEGDSLDVTNNATIGGTATVTGNVTGGNLTTAGTMDSATINTTGEATLASATVTGNLAGGNLTTAGTMDSATINTTGEATLASATVSDLTDNRVVIAGTSGALEDDANFTFDGSTMTVSADASITGTADVQTGLIVGDVAANLTSGATLEVAGTDSILVPVGTSAQRPGTPATGMIRFNTTIDSFEFYDNDSWTTAGSEFTVIGSEIFNGDGSTVAFTISDDQTTASCIISINGVVQLPTTAYAVSGTTVTFTEAPLSGDVIEVRKLTTTNTVLGINNSDSSAAVTVEDSSDVVEITGNLLPATNETQNIGSASLRWNELFLAGSTITMGNIVMKDTGGSIGFFGADGTTPAPVDEGSVDATSIASGTSNVAVAENSSVTVSVAGSTAATFASSGLTVAGNLTVSGTTTTVNSSTLDVADKNITIADGAADSAAADGAGLTVDGASATFTYTNSGDKWNMNKDLDLGANNFITSGEFQGTATSAQYADLAENYSADADYAPGTVVVFGGDAEVTLATTSDDHRVAGVITTNPAYLMNSHIEADHIAGVAFTGRVPCKVTGTVNKGDLMVSAGNGMAKANNNPGPGTIIGKALENSEGDAVIEVVVGRF